jgi:hypothetical protein
MLTGPGALFRVDFVIRATKHWTTPTPSSTTFSSTTSTAWMNSSGGNDKGTKITSDLIACMTENPMPSASDRWGRRANGRTRARAAIRSACVMMRRSPRNSKDHENLYRKCAVPSFPRRLPLLQSYSLAGGRCWPPCYIPLNQHSGCNCDLCSCLRMLGCLAGIENDFGISFSFVSRCRPSQKFVGRGSRYLQTSH